jgi:uracil-DNA glycosylase
LTVGDTGSVDPIDRLLDDLKRAQIGTTFNPYRDTDPALDRPGAAAIRLGNLADHLRTRPHPALLLVGEAAGYAGCRFSGIAFTSERSRPPERRTSNDPRGHVEHSASIVHRILGELELEDETVLWNVCPTHPAGSTPLSNRTPTKDELAAGRPYLVRLIAILQPGLVVTVGAHAHRALPRLATVRHPANGGSPAFRAGLAAVVPDGRGRIARGSPSLT